MKSGTVALVILSAVLATSGLSANAADRGPSTPEEREQALQYIQAFEANPLSTSNSDGLAWVTKWVIQVPDIHIKLCISLLKDLPKGNKKDSQELFNGLLLGQTQWAIENLDKQSDTIAQQMAGVEAALNVYEKLLAQKPGDRQAHMDELLARRNAGTLRQYVEDAVVTNCKN